MPAYPDGARTAIGANMLRAKSFGAFVDRTVYVLHAGGRGDDALKSFHYSIDILVHALGVLRSRNRRQT
ncbi:hypothetical protein [Nocardia brasiliensis]|uniref:hypothetical protein n=1 Tax=Nocardia brasiliensis TaxID=37326 RepID=UPI003D8A9E47